MRKLLSYIILLFTFPLFAGTVRLQDEGTTQGYPWSLDCTGTGVSCSVSGSKGTINVSGGSGSSPLTTKGDIFTYDTDDARLPVGTNGQILTADSTQSLGIKWATGGSGESNTASNTGSAGTGVFKQKTTVDLEFYKLNSATPSELTIALDGTDKIDFSTVSLKDLVTTAPITGGIDDILPGADSDVTIAMPVATSIADGYLDKDDWTTFNNKVGTEVDPNALLTADTNNVKDTHIDWGTGANQVSAVDVPIADSGSIITATEVEGALQENRTAVDLNTAHRTSNGTDHSYINQDVTSTASPSFAGLTVESNTIDFGDVTEDYVLTFNATTNTWAGEVSSGGGSGDNVTVNGSAIDTTANFKDTTEITYTVVDGGAGGPDDIEASVDVIDGTKVEIEEIGTATYDDVQDWVNTTQSAGKLTGGGFTDNGDGSLTVAAGTGFIKTTDSDVGVSKFFDWSADASVALTDNDTNYIYVEYNAGSPQVAVSLTMPTDKNTNVMLGLIYREGTDLHEISAGQVVSNFAKKVTWKDIEINGKFQRASGLMISETGTRNYAYTAGSVYGGFTSVSLSAFDSSGADTFTAMYRDGSGGWTKITSQSAINNTQYDDGSGTLATLSDGGIFGQDHYGVHWAYTDIDGDDFIVIGQGDYTLAQANNATPPSTIPELLSSVGGLIGKIIIQKNASSFTSIQSPFTTTFSASSVQNHNDLANIQGGSSDEYYHLTNARHTDLTDGGDSTLHYHATDRARANHTGTQTASTISDFDTEVSNNPDVTANTAKVTNATHTGQVTGSGALTVDKTAITDQSDVVIATGDYVIYSDTSDSSNLKKDTVQGILDLVSSAPTNADYLVGTANGSLSAEIVVGTSPGGELGGTWASPTIDDSVSVTSWTLTTPTVNTTLTMGDASHIILDAVPASDHTGTGLVASVTVDANTYGIASALVLSSDGNYDEADANAVGTMPCSALALESGTGTKKVLLQGFIRDDTWAWTVGGLIYVSGTTGTLTQTAPSATGDYIQIVGYATHADRMYFNPNLMMIKHN